MTLILRKTTDANRRCSKTTASFISNLFVDDVGFERRTQYSSLLSRHSHANNKFAFSLPRMCVQAQLVTLVFTARRSCVSAVLAVVILSVCLSHACFVTKPNNALRIFATARKGNHTTVVCGRRPLLSEIYAQSDPPPFKTTPTSTDFRL